jgi:hypothetical protein
MGQGLFYELAIEPDTGFIPFDSRTGIRPERVAFGPLRYWIPSLTFEPDKFRPLVTAKLAERHLGDTLNLV